MLQPAEILAMAGRKWPAALRADASNEKLFPLRIRFGRPPTTGDMTLLRPQIASLAAAAHGWRIDWEDVRTRKWGRQRWPARVIFDSVDDLAAALGKSAELRMFRDALRDTRQKCPWLEPWLCANAHRIVEHLPHWTGLLAVCATFDANPCPNCYIRQVAAPVDTKFIESHEGILRELLDATLGARANQSGTSFAERFHIRMDPPQVRFRFLDEQLQARTGWPVTDCSVPAPIFAKLDWSVPRVLIVENREVFLCLPNVINTLSIFGAGKAATLLSACEWISRADVVYWGDCDEAGYGILSDLRACFPRLRSLLMDDEAWIHWKHLAVPGKRDPTVRHSALTAGERTALREAVAGPWVLEQERIPLVEAERAIVAAFA